MGKNPKRRRKSSPRKAASLKIKAAPITNILLLQFNSTVLVILTKFLLVPILPTAVLAIYLLSNLSYTIYKLENDSLRFLDFFKKLCPKFK